MGRDNCYAGTWKVISNSFDVDYIHGDVLDQSYKELIPKYGFELRQYSRD